MEFGKWEQTIKSNLRNRTDVTSTEEFKSVYGAAHKRPRLSVIELNETMREVYKEKGREFKELKVFSPEEMDRRYKLSQKAHDIYVERAAKNLMNPVPSTGTSLRYPEDTIMRHEPGEEAERFNERVRECFAHPEQHKEEILDLHIGMLKDIERYEKFLKESHSDEDIVEHSNLIIDGSKKCLQVENMTEFLGTLKFETPEEQDKLTKLNGLLDRYRTIEKVMPTYTGKLSNIQCPLYSVIDPYDENSRAFFRDSADPALALSESISSAELDLDCEEVGGSTPMLFPYMIEANINHRDDIEHELTAMTALLSYDDSECKIKIEGVKGEFDDIQKAVSEIEKHPGSKVTVTNPKNNESLEVSDFSKLYYVGKVVEAEDMTYKTEELPEPVPKPVTPEPERPGLFARLLHAVSFGRLFKKTFDDYDRQKTQHDSEQSAYDEYQKEFDRIKSLSVLQKKHLAKVHPDYEDTKPGMITSDIAYVEQKDRSGFERGTESIMNIYGAVRERQAALINNSVYNHDVFRTMKGNDVNLSECKPKGLEVDDKTFVAMSMVTVLADEFDSKRSRKLADTIGFEDLSNSSNHFLPRAGMHEYIKNVIEPARKNVADCLKFFDQNIPGLEPPKTGRERLVETFGEGLKKAAVRVASYKLDSPSEAISTDMVVRTLDFAEKLGIMDDLKKNGLDDGMIEKIRVGQKCSEIIRDRYEAERQLMKENHGDLTLTVEEKRALIDKIALGRTLSAIAKAEDERCADLKLRQIEELLSTAHLPDETNEAYNARMAENAAKFTALQNQGMSANDVQVPVIKDLQNGGAQLRELSERLMEPAERDKLAQLSSYEIYKATTKAEFEQRNKATPYDDFVEQAFATVKNPASTKKEIQHAAAVVVSAFALIDAGKVSKDDVKNFDSSVNKLVEDPAFIRAIGSEQNIRDHFFRRKEATIAFRKVTSEVSKAQNEKKEVKSEVQQVISGSQESKENQKTFIP